MTMFKKNGGFTLVELIVVIAILAILAGVAIPAYSGYIKKAQDVNVVTELDAIAGAVQAANAKAGAIASISFTGDKIEVVVDAKVGFADDFMVNFDMFYGGTEEGTGSATKKTIKLTEAVDVANTNYVAGADWAGGKWTAKAVPTGN